MLLWPEPFSSALAGNLKSRAVEITAKKQREVQPHITREVSVVALNGVIRE